VFKHTTRFPNLYIASGLSTFCKTSGNTLNIFPCSKHVSINQMFKRVSYPRIIISTTLNPFVIGRIFSSNSHLWQPGSSVSTLSAAGCTTGQSGFNPRHRQNDFSSNLCVHTGSGAHPAFCLMGRPTGAPFPGAKA
jgi:hypothetical protein